MGRAVLDLGFFQLNPTQSMIVLKSENQPTKFCLIIPVNKSLCVITIDPCP